MVTILRPILTATPSDPPSHNFGLCETFSYIPVAGAGRPLYARASYITNFSDMAINLSAGELSIGSVTIKDNGSGLTCDVVTDPDNNLNALRVITQDLDSDYDDITIGDKNGIHFATIDGSLSSLNVKVTNLSSVESRLERQIAILNSLTALNLKEFNETQTLLNSLTSLQNNKQNNIITLLNTLTSNTDSLEINTNQVETLILNSNTLLNTLTTLNLKEFNEVQTLQNETITLLTELTTTTHVLEENTNNIEPLIVSSNSYLETLTSINSFINVKQDSLINLLNALTADTNSLENYTDGIETSFIESNNLLNALTSVDFATSFKQNSIISLLESLTSKETNIQLDISDINVNTDEIEGLIYNTNTLLNALTGKTTITDLSSIEARLDMLTSVNYANAVNQEQAITLLQNLTGIILDTNSIKLSIDETESLLSNSNSFLNSLTSVTQKEFDQTQELLNALSGIEIISEQLSSIDFASSLNQNTQISLQNVLTSQNVETQNLLKDLTGSNLDITTFLDTITSQEQQQISLQTILSTNSVYGTLPSQPLYITGITSSPITITLGDSPNLDAFGRIRVSEPHTLLDAKHLYDKLPLTFYEKISGTATSQFIPGDSLVRMETSNPGDYVIRQTRHHFNYQTGKSIQALFTGLFKPETNIIKRVGLFQSLSASPSIPSDGMFLEIDENGPKICLVKTEGTVNSLSIPRSLWNVDSLDGTGPSGINIDFNKSQIFTLDYEWLGIGRIRFGFIQSGKTYYCHYINNINSLEEVYMTSPNQPIRYQIEQIGPGSGKMHHICSTVMVEGGEESVGKPISITDGVIGGIGVMNYKTLLAVRLNPLYYNSSIILKSVEVLNTGQNEGIFDVLLNPTLISGSLNWANTYNAPIQYSTGGAIVSGGYSVFKALVPGGLGGSSTSQNLAIPGEITKLGISIEQVPDIVVIAAKSFQNTTTMIAVANLLERS
jgi:hypothetical protein